MQCSTADSKRELSQHLTQGKPQFFNTRRGGRKKKKASITICHDIPLFSTVSIRKQSPGIKPAESV